MSILQNIVGSRNGIEKAKSIDSDVVVDDLLGKNPDMVESQQTGGREQVLQSIASRDKLENCFQPYGSLQRHYKTGTFPAGGWRSVTFRQTMML